MIFCWHKRSLVLWAGFLFFAATSPLVALNIAYASNLENVMPQLQEAFYKQHPDIILKLTSGSSGELAHQIRKGAAVDIFLSGDAFFAHKLYQDGFASAKPKVYALGKLVLWSNLANIELDVNLDILLDSQIKSIGIAHPQKSTYGRAAWQSLEKNNILNAIKDKFFYADTASLVAVRTFSKAVDVAFLARSAVFRSQGKWVEVDSKLYPPIKQTMVLLKYLGKSGKHEQAKKFFYFLLSQTAQEIFIKHGYQVP